MAAINYYEEIEMLKQKGICFVENLTEMQLQQIEEEYHISFPSALRDFYMQVMPTSGSFINWLDDSEENKKKIRARLQFPLRSILNEVEDDGLWAKYWGRRPENMEDALRKAEEHLKSAETLIPVYGHRYLVCLKNNDNPPVISVYGSDMILYGQNLKQWMQIEFKKIPHRTAYESPIPFIQGWSEWL